MKRMVSIIAVTMLTIALTACGGSTGGGKQRTGSRRGAERNS